MIAALLISILLFLRYETHAGTLHSNTTSIFLDEKKTLKFREYRSEAGIWESGEWGGDYGEKWTDVPLVTTDFHLRPWRIYAKCSKRVDYFNVQYYDFHSRSNEKPSDMFATGTAVGATERGDYNQAYWPMELDRGEYIIGIRIGKCRFMHSFTKHSRVCFLKIRTNVGVRLECGEADPGNSALGQGSRCMIPHKPNGI